MAFGTGSEELLIEGQDFMLAGLAVAITENRVGLKSSATADFVSVIAAGA